jgi:large subunit ribosomal protein L23
MPTKKTTAVKKPAAPKKAIATKKEKVEKTEEKNPPAGGVVKNTVILKARITEKAANLAEKNGYTFDVAPNATKNEIKKAIKAMYKVTPSHVRTVNMSSKKVMPRGRRGKVGTTGGGRKAYVYLKKGDKIEVL